MALDVKKYAEDLVKEAGVSDDAARQAILNFFSNDSVAKRVASEHMMQSDYNRNLDALRVDKEKWTQFYKDTLAKTTENQKVVDAYHDQLQRYKTEFGELNDDGSTRQLTTSVGLTKDDLTKTLNDSMQQRDGNIMAIIKTGLKLASQHIHEFKEPLDVDTLEKTAVERNISLQQAYDEMVKPKREAATTASVEARIAEARAEGARDFASKHKIPVDMAQREPSPLAARLAIKDTDLPQTGPARERAVRESFVDAWNSGADVKTSGVTA